jgi:hypothetical protein
MFYLASKGFHLAHVSGPEMETDAIPLDRRAKTLSSYAGDTALPGGMIDNDDKTIEDTAVRPDASSSCSSDCNTVDLQRDGRRLRRSSFSPTFPRAVLC